MAFGKQSNGRRIELQSSRSRIVVVTTGTIFSKKASQTIHFDVDLFSVHHSHPYVATAFIAVASNYIACKPHMFNVELPLPTTQVAPKVGVP